MAKRSAGRTVTRTVGRNKTIVRKDKPAAAQRTAPPRGARMPVGRAAPARTARARATPKDEPADAHTQADDTAAAASAQQVPEDSGAAAPTDVVAEAQRQADELSTAFFSTNPILAQMVDARDGLRGKYNAVKGLPQYAREEALYKGQLDELDRRIAGRA